jgi:hypothetical protein
MNESIVAINETYDRRMQELRDMFGGRVPPDMMMTADDKIELQDLRELMREFREFEREMKAKAKQRKKSRKSGKPG